MTTHHVVAPHADHHLPHQPHHPPAPPHAHQPEPGPVARSMNGWPVLAKSSGNLGLLHRWTLPAEAGTTAVTLRQGSAGFLLALTGMRFAASVQPLFGDVLDDWGWAVRPIRGRLTGYSNHASGTAFDMNATRHPLGRRDTFRPEQVHRIHRLLEMVDGALGWGGDYLHRKDEMHFEVASSLEHCEQVARAAVEAAGPNVVALLEANPGQREVIFS